MENKVVSGLKSDPTSFFAYVNSRRKEKSHIGPLKEVRNGTPHYIYDPKRMADMLSNQYKSVFSVPLPDKKVRDPASFFHSSQMPNQMEHLLDIVLNPEEMEVALTELKSTASNGPKGWSAFLLHKYPKVFAGALCKLWRKSLDTGIMPEGVNLAYITPIFKGGDKSDPANYRPIALTSHITKTFERVLRKKIIEHLGANDLINNTQHGFTPRRSTMTQLIQYYTTILDSMANSKQMDVVYLDFAKAFDKCDHGVIAHKLRAFGIGGKVGIWIHQFLTQRQQQVRLSGHLSEKEWVVSGVPQGSVLGPLLFTILILDIDVGVLTSAILTYADDTKIFKAIENLKDAELLQDDLATLYTWSTTNNQDFNAKKFESMSYSANNHRNLYFSPSGDAIQSKDHIRDLGVTFSVDATFDKHVDIITGKARRLSGWMLRTFISRDSELMLALLKQLIIPTLEYCCPVWSPGDATNINKLEKVQKSFTKKIFGLSKMHYWDRLEKLHLFSLQRRRERYLILYIWKIIHGLVPDVGVVYAPTNNNEGIKLRLPALKGPAKIRKLMENGLLYHGVRLFNMLPADLRQTSSAEETANIDSFKRRLDQFLWLIPDEPGPNKGDKTRAAESNSLLHQVLYQKAPPPPADRQTGRPRYNKRRGAHASMLDHATWKPAASRWDDSTDGAQSRPL